jgi:hypothetical protein
LKIIVVNALVLHFKWRASHFFNPPLQACRLSQTFSDFICVFVISFGEHVYLRYLIFFFHVPLLKWRACHSWFFLFNFFFACYTFEMASIHTHSFFPYFMLVAFEGGSIFRAFFLLMSCPLLLICDHELKLKIMTFITFCGLRIKDMENVSRAVLPKFYLENLNLQVYEVLASAGSKVVITSVPRVMVEGFLKEYLSVGDVLGTELHTFNLFATLLVFSLVLAYLLSIEHLRSILVIENLILELELQVYIIIFSFPLML